MMFIWIVGFGVLIYLLFKDDQLHLNKDSNAKSVLDSRLANGEISTEEYLSIIKVMKEK